MRGMFRRVLVANRGEVAVRVARTCRRMGVSPVAVFSEADSGAPWLGFFDEAICIGPTHPVRSYLDQDAILEAAELTDCQAVHPGWGFLAENALFAARVRQLQLAWIGPSPRAIGLMGDKALARQTMARAGLPPIPGGDGLLADVNEAREAARRVGLPVMLKAAAGGGGKGMRLCRTENDLAEAFAEAAREAEAAFGDGRLYLEKFIERGRHIEFQVLGDSWGHVIHLGERECSVQRRRQKLIEEGPSPALDPRTRREVGERVTRALSLLRYESAGTVEFLRDPDGALHFMEMNTRLQVEHPVTEMITGLDIVEHQLRIAAGEPLAVRQEDIHWNGWAIEARINAEDPAQDFKPAPGRIEVAEFPRDLGPGAVRVDTHLVPPCDVPPFYDSLVAKVIAHGDTRAAALDTLARSLAAAKVNGAPTTIPTHLAVLEDSSFRAGAYDTSILAGLLPAPEEKA